MQNHSQLDPKWENIKMGNSTTTIGSIGCLITCLGMLADKNPAQVNIQLKWVNGYDPNSKVIWSKIDETNLGLVFVKRAYSYNNQDVINNLPCLVEVRFKLIRHWVLFIGNRRMIDPLTGKNEDTNKYPLIGYAVVRKKDIPQPQLQPQPLPSTISSIFTVSELKLQELYHYAFGPRRFLDTDGRNFYVPQIQNGRNLENILCELVKSLEHKAIFTKIEELKTIIETKRQETENKDSEIIRLEEENCEIRKMNTDLKDNPRKNLPLK